jgi:beclin 1
VVKVLAEDRDLPLYGSGGFRLMWDTKFDAGMCAFLDCLQQFKVGGPVLQSIDQS